MNDQLAKPLADSERRASRQALNQLHPGNRFRLMFGQPLLPQDDYEPETHQKAMLKTRTDRCFATGLRSLTPDGKLFGKENPAWKTAPYEEILLIKPNMVGIPKHWVELCRSGSK